MYARVMITALVRFDGLFPTDGYFKSRFSNQNNLVTSTIY